VLANLRQRLDRLAASELDPSRTAAAIALGVFLSFSPFLGLQILIGLGAAFAFRLSRVAVLVGLCANLPWIMVPWYAATTAAAAAMIGTPSPIAGDAGLGLAGVSLFDPASLARTGIVAADLLWPFLLGPTAGALVLGAVAYVVSFNMLSRRRRRAAGLPAPADPSDGPAGDAQQRAPDRHVHDAERARLEP
jgi:uncharacterized protein (DUF2062 family)